MTLTIRNQFVATVDSIVLGDNAVLVRAKVAKRRKMTAVVSSESFKDLDLRVGGRTRVLFQSDRVSLATGPMKRLSIRNQLAGTVTDVTIYDALALVRVEVEERKMVATITKEAVAALDLRSGSFVVVLIDSTDVSLDAD